METVTYLRMWTRNGKMFNETVTVSIVELYNEIWHKSFKTAQDLINYWDIVGKGMGKYRYFLISPNTDLRGKIVN